MQNTNTPRISVVIPCYNEEAAIGACLDALASQIPQPSEVIVVDNNCTDRTAEIAQSYSFVTVIQETEQGMTPARNAGMAAASGDVLARIDADTIVQPGWIEALERIFSDPHIAAATGPVRYHDMPGQKAGEAADREVRAALDAISRQSDFRFLFGTNMAVRRDVWKHIVNDLCNDDSLHEDIDIALHIHERHGIIKYDRKMTAGMSARRLDDKPRDFYKYIMKFERTYDRHHVKSITARAPVVIYLATYFPFKLLRSVYDGENHKFTLKKLFKTAAEKNL